MTRLLGVFFALCAAVALVFAGIDAYVKRQHEQWPPATAIVKSAVIRIEHPTVRNGGGTWYQLRAAVVVDGRPCIIRSSSARQAGVMNSWIERHPPGSAIVVRLDPHDSTSGVPANPEDLPMKQHPKEDLILAAIGAALSATFLWAGAR